MSGVSSSLQGRDRTPLMETVLGVQFAPIDNFTIAHFGWFWKEYLDSSWTKAQDAPLLPTQFEKFADEDEWVTPPFPVFIAPGSFGRVFLINDTDENVIQIQNNKFLYNWRRQGDRYPSFEGIYPVFLRYLGAFEGFLRDVGLEPTPHNQWELTYVNHILRGTLWETLSDWQGIFPGLLNQAQPNTGVIAEPIGNWRFEIPPRRGRLHVAVRHAKKEDDQEVLQLSLTARGPVVPGENDRDLSACLRIGHDAIVETFRSIASRDALSYWSLE